MKTKKHQSFKKSSIFVIALGLVAVLLLCLALFLVKKYSADTNSPQSISIYVSTAGNDTWSGNYSEPNKAKTDGPFATIQRARDEIKNLKNQNKFNKPVNVYVKAGTYDQDSPISFTNEDSGTDAFPITYQGYGGAVNISGGEKITSSWTQCAAQKAECQGLVDPTKVYYTDLKTDSNFKDTNFDTLFLNDQRATRARTPNIGQDTGLRDADNKPMGQGYYNVLPDSAFMDGFDFRTGDINPSWHNLQDIEVNVLIRWFTFRHKISSIAGNKVTLVGNSTSNYNYDYPPSSNGRYYLDNVFEGLDTAGEWYLDKTPTSSNYKKLYFYPADVKDLEQITAPKTTQLLNISGQEKENIKGSFTISHWIKTSSDARMYTLGNTGAGDGIRFGLNAGKIAFLAGNGNTPGSGYVEATCGSGGLNDNQWHMISGIFNFEQGKFTCYKDGVKSGEVAVLPSFVNHKYSPLTIGTPPCCAAYSGLLDEVKIYHRALSDDDIADLYQTNGTNVLNPEVSLSFENNLTDKSGLLDWTSKSPPVYVASDKPGLGMAMNFAAGNAVSPVENYDLVGNISFKGINFLYTDWDLPALGYNDIQAVQNIPSPSSVSISHATDIKIQNGLLRHLGGHAIEMTFTSNTEIDNNEISDTGYGGIKLGDGGSASKSDNDKIINNKIFNLGNVISDGDGILAMLVKNTTIANNDISDTGYTGIQLGWDWGGAVTGAENNTIENNYVHQVMQILNDGAGMYIIGNQPNTEVKNNLIYSSKRTSSHIFDHVISGLYLDNLTSGISLINNVVYDCDMALELNGNKVDNKVTNNIFAYNENSINWPHFSLSGGRFEFVNNIILGTKSTKKIFGITMFSDGTFDKNLYYLSQGVSPIIAANYISSFKPSYVDSTSTTIMCTESNRYIQSGCWNQLSSYTDYLTFKSGTGADANSITDKDPQFTDQTVFSSTNSTIPLKRNYSLKATSPALGLGFQQIDTSTIGVQDQNSNQPTITATYPLEPTTGTTPTATPTEPPTGTISASGNKSFSYKDKYRVSGTKPSNIVKVLVNNVEATVDNNANTWTLETTIPIGQTVLNVIGKDKDDDSTPSALVTITRRKPADANADNAINMADFSKLMSNWGKQESANDADFDEDNKVGMSDFSIMMNNWGK